MRVARAIGAVLVVCVALGLSALRAPGQGEPLRIAMYGDSVMLGARAQLLAQFAGMPVTVDAQEDRSLLGAIDTFRGPPGALGDVVVLDLGYNDSDDPVVFRGRVDAAMTALAGVDRVIWLNQHEFTPGRAGMNQELAAAAGRYPNLDVVDWNAEVGAHPEAVYEDAIHLTPAGQVAMAALVRQHYDRYVDSLRPTTTATAATTTSTTTTDPPTRRHAARPAAGPDDTTRRVVVAVGASALAVVVLVVGTAIVLARRRTVRR